MTEVDIFYSILNKNKVSANDLYRNHDKELNHILQNSRLKPLYLDLLDLNNRQEEQFNSIKKNILLRNQLIISEAINLSRFLHKYKINHVFIKGVSSLFQLKDSKKIRYSSDIDILIDVQDLKKFHLMLVEIGADHSFDYSHDYKESKLNYTVGCIKLNTGIDLDVHFRASSPIDFRYCPFTELFLKNYDTYNYNDIKINVSKVDQLYVFAIYQLFVKDDINNSSSSIIDLILINSIKGRIPNKNKILLDYSAIKKAMLEWQSILNIKNKNNKKVKIFTSRIFAEPKLKKLRYAQVIIRNILFLKKSVKEKYGIEAKNKNLYYKFFYDKIKKLSSK